MVDYSADSEEPEEEVSESVRSPNKVARAKVVGSKQNALLRTQAMGVTSSDFDDMFENMKHWSQQKPRDPALSKASSKKRKASDGQKDEFLGYSKEELKMLGLRERSPQKLEESGEENHENQKYTMSSRPYDS